MNISQLESLAALADTGSFTEAAETLQVTQSAVSHALAALERELGVRVLERNRRGVTALTDAGRRIMPHVRALLANGESIEQEARAARGQTAGKVRVGSISSFVPPRLLAGVLTAFQQRYPAIELVLFEGALHEVGEWLERSIVDIAFVILPAPGTASTPLLSDELCVLVPPGHALRSRAAVTPGELRGAGLIMEKTHCALHFLTRMGFESSIQLPAVRFQASDSATIFAMVREGLGITLVPRRMLPPRLEGMHVLPLDPPQKVELGVAVRSQELASPGAVLFIETAVELAGTLRSPRSAALRRSPRAPVACDARTAALPYRRLPPPRPAVHRVAAPHTRANLLEPATPNPPASRARWRATFGKPLAGQGPARLLGGRSWGSCGLRQQLSEGGLAAALIRGTS